ncbi:GNAT family N-acetyltransferase [Asticcacaulis benevestitus]|uniref:BioF2-like acetyltransferase domain-containing protein n=1 Tax=Asticcacaulis benevestitus DSM 16100 = ATCC BAA-896 TaxID=1121022 RepID=V4PHF7_9CAUL|nr:GNAT family N-acetyltransferase [Asticcacaulis benevestitus]ESQ87601.1 hypothetical protein ABENE_17190 [Asticcacaulis benevestitus DSM 16100 = ATCC BAA-896]
MLEGRILDSLAAIPPADWDACFGDPLEGHAYHLAIETAALKGFTFFYVAVYDHARLVGAAPAFLTQYDLATTIDNLHLGRAIKQVQNLIPGFLRVRLAALGSPCTEHVMLGVSEPGRTYAIVDCLLRTFEAGAKARGGRLLAIKDLSDEAPKEWAACIEDLGYGFVTGLPSSELRIDFESTDAYLSRLTPGTRRDMRRKLRSREHLRCEDVTSLRAYAPRVMALYEDTLARADMTLEELSFDYFESVLSLMPNQAICRLYFHGETLLAVNLLLHDQNTLLDKYFLMAPEGRAYNLYFVSWFDNVALCLERGLRRFQTGQAAYANKLRLGVDLIGTRMAFKHKNGLLSFGLRLIAPLVSADLSPEALRNE